MTMKKETMDEVRGKREARSAKVTDGSRVSRPRSYTKRGGAARWASRGLVATWFRWQGAKGGKGGGGGGEGG